MKISIQKVAFLSLLAGVLPACHETGTNQVRSDGSIPVTVLQPTTVELPRPGYTVCRNKTKGGRIRQRSID